LVGVLLNAVPRAMPMFQAEAWRNLRFPGILQRIAVCGFLATLISRRASRRTLIVVIAGLLLTHAILLLFVPPPGAAAVSWTPRGTIAWWLDWTILGSHSKASYAFDPLGILGTLSGLATVLIGVLAGRMVAEAGEPAPTAATLATCGFVLMLAGTALAPLLPINESLWTASYALLMTGISTGAFACLYWWIDGRSLGRGVCAPLVAFGRNALLLFVGSQILTSLVAAKGFVRDGRWVSVRGHLHEALTAVVGSPRFASLLYALLFVSLFFLLAVFLNRRRWYWTL
jgi:predicted acyltransferase